MHDLTGSASQCIEVLTEHQVVTVVTGGPRGPKGPAGDGGTFPAVAGATIHGHRAVRIADGRVYHPDVLDPTHATTVIGIAMQSATVDDWVVVRTDGLVSEASWAWLPGTVWCGQDGVLTQSPAATGWILAMGRAVSATEIAVDVSSPFMR